MWGKVGHAWHGKGSVKGKERVEVGAAEWNVLESWDIDLDDLVPMPDDVRFPFLSLFMWCSTLTRFWKLIAHSSKLPPNTLVVTLSPPGQTYYIPPPVPVRPSLEATGGYTSDPELDSRKDRRVGELVLAAASPPGFVEKLLPLDDDPASVAAMVKSRTRSHRDGAAKTASWQDLLKCVHFPGLWYFADGKFSQAGDAASLRRRH